eukprot:jgi/Mesvir1/29480/Mv06405-RA.1
MGGGLAGGMNGEVMDAPNGSGEGDGPNGAVTDAGSGRQGSGGGAGVSAVDMVSPSGRRASVRTGRDGNAPGSPLSRSPLRSPPSRLARSGSRAGGVTSPSSGTQQSRALLGELYADHEYLQELRKDEGLRDLIGDGLESGKGYIEGRMQFWRQQDPFEEDYNSAGPFSVDYDTNIRPVSRLVARSPTCSPTKGGSRSGSSLSFAAGFRGTTYPDNDGNGPDVNGSISSSSWGPGAGSARASQAADAGYSSGGKEVAPSGSSRATAATAVASWAPGSVSARLRAVASSVSSYSYSNTTNGAAAAGHCTEDLGRGGESNPRKPVGQAQGRARTALYGSRGDRLGGEDGAFPLGRGDGQNGADRPRFATGRSALDEGYAPGPGRRTFRRSFSGRSDRPKHGSDGGMGLRVGAQAGDDSGGSSDEREGGGTRSWRGFHGQDREYKGCGEGEGEGAEGAEGAGEGMGDDGKGQGSVRGQRPSTAHPTSALAAVPAVAWGKGGKDSKPGVAPHLKEGGQVSPSPRKKQARNLLRLQYMEQTSYVLQSLGSIAAAMEAADYSMVLRLGRSLLLRLSTLDVLDKGCHMANVLLAIGTAYHELGEGKLAADVLAKAAQLGQACGYGDVAGRAFIALGTALQGTPGQAAAAGRAWEAATPYVAPDMLPKVLMSAARNLLESRELHRASACCEQLLELSDGTDADGQPCNKEMRMGALALSGECLLRQGDTDEALSQLKACLLLARELKEGGVEKEVMLLLGDSHRKAPLR